MPREKFYEGIPLVTISSSRIDESDVSARFVSEGEVIFQLPKGGQMKMPFRNAVNSDEAIKQAAEQLELQAEQFLRWAQTLLGR